MTTALSDKATTTVSGLSNTATALLREAITHTAAQAGSVQAISDVSAALSAHLRGEPGPSCVAFAATRSGAAFRRDTVVARGAALPRSTAAQLRGADDESSSRRTTPALHRPSTAPATVSEMWC